MLPDTQLMLVTFKVIIILCIPKILHAYQCSIVLLCCAGNRAQTERCARGRAVTHAEIVSDLGLPIDPDGPLWATLGKADQSQGQSSLYCAARSLVSSVTGGLITPWII